MKYQIRTPPESSTTDDGLQPGSQAWSSRYVWRGICPAFSRSPERSRGGLTESEGVEWTLLSAKACFTESRVGKTGKGTASAVLRRVATEDQRERSEAIVTAAAGSAS